MCSPQAMATVQRVITRRRFIGAAGSTGALAVLGGVGRPQSAALQGAATPGATPVITPLGTPIATGCFGSVLDLTHTITPDFPVFPGSEQFQANVLVTVEQDGFYKNQLVLDEHTGTHMDAPAHFDANGVTADILPVANFVAPLAAIDVMAKVAANDDYQVTVDDILGWESENGTLPEGAFVAMHSGWETRLATPGAFLNADAGGTLHFPGFGPDAAAFLVEERTIVGIGVDTISLDFGASTDFATHLTVLPAGKYGLENLANLSAAPPVGATIVVGGPKHLNASGGPSRVLTLF